MRCEYCKSECGEDDVKCPNCGAPVSHGKGISGHIYKLYKMRKYILPICAPVLVIVLCITLMVITPSYVPTENVPLYWCASTECKTVLRQLNTYISTGEYGRAVEYAETNQKTIENNRLLFSSLTADMQAHFTRIAKLYYTSAATHIVKQQVQGYDFDCGLEGYDPKTEELDPEALKYRLSDDELAVMKRVTIYCDSREETVKSVKINYCGRTAEYPTNDIIVD